MSYYAVTYSKSLSHHGIKGQEWGKRNGPPYPLGSEDHSVSEKKAHWRSSLDKPKKSGGQNSSKSSKTSKNKKNSEVKKDARPKKRGTVDEKEFRESVRRDNEKVSEKEVSKLLCISKEDAKTLKKVATAAGISLAVGAGIFAAAYMIHKNPELLKKVRGTISGEINPFSSNALLSKMGLISTDFNASRTSEAYNIGEALFQNRNNNGFKLDPIGAKADFAGFTTLTKDNFFKTAKLPEDIINDRDQLAKLMRVRFAGSGSNNSRRLSCWSAAHAYFMSNETGQQYISRNFQNLVNFNDFAKLYTKPQTIFNAVGERATDFVGRYGEGEFRAGRDTAESLVNSIIKNISVNDNGPTIGFINAAYHDSTCTHQWNFEIEKLSEGVKQVFMTDCYTGSRYAVGQTAVGSNFSFDEKGLERLIKNLGHYNANSIRFYKPELSEINPETMANVILGYIEEVKHFMADLVGEYYALTFSNSLSHHGIKGQKWGNRRYQNEDGTLTEEGRRRYGRLGTSFHATIDYHKDYSNARKRYNQSVKELRNKQKQELKELRKTETEKYVKDLEAANRKRFLANESVRKNKVWLTDDIYSRGSDRRLGREILADKKVRKDRGKKLVNAGRTEIGAIGRGVAREVGRRAAIDILGATALLGVVYLSKGNENVISFGRSVINGFTEGAKFNGSIINAVRTYQDVADIRTYKESKAKKR